MIETSFSIKFDYVEQVLLGLGESIKELNEEINKRDAKGAIPGWTTLFTIRRWRYLNQVAKELDVIYNDVNEETRKTIELLYMRGKGFDEVSVELNIKESNLHFRHELMVVEMMILLGEISEDEKRARRISKRKSIPKNIKEQVYKRDLGMCVMCSSEEGLHMHHIKRFAEGGKDTVDNLTLLCASCHAEEHKGESSYHLLKVMV